MNGLSLTDFPCAEYALEAADELIKLSADEFHFKPETLEHDNLLLSRHYYIVSHGKNRKITNGHSKVVSGDADLNKDGKAVAPVKALQDSDMSVFVKPGTGPIKLEFPHLIAAHKGAENLRSVCTHTHTQRAPDISS